MSTHYCYKVFRNTNKEDLQKNIEHLISENEELRAQINQQHTQINEQQTEITNLKRTKKNFITSGKINNSTCTPQTTTDYLLIVLLSETAILLIMEDFKYRFDKARKIIEESVAYGSIFNNEEKILIDSENDGSDDTDEEKNSDAFMNVNDPNKPVQHYLNMVYLTFGGLCSLAASEAYTGLYLIK
ncbi:4893_t:CDS:2, partial [Racocetra persica]